MFDGFVVMSGGHCTHPTGGPAIRLKHKKINTGAASSQGVSHVWLRDRLTAHSLD